MRLFPAVGLASLFLVIALALQASGQGKDKDKKFEPKDAVAGTVKAVDLKASSFTITPDKGKDRTFVVDDKTEFLGTEGRRPRHRRQGLEGRLRGARLRSQGRSREDGKTAKDVYLPTRKAKK
jgi:hypothetical protein